MVTMPWGRRTMSGAGEEGGVRGSGKVEEEDFGEMAGDDDVVLA